MTEKALLHFQQQLGILPYRVLKKTKRTVARWVFAIFSMPKEAKTHGQLRSMVCLVCFQKRSDIWIITGGVVLERIRTSFMTNYDPEDQYVPNGLCGRCRKILERIAGGSADADSLPNPVDFGALDFPALTRSSGAPKEQQDLTNCPCGICSVATVHAGKIGHPDFRKGSIPRGPQPKPGPKRLATPRPIKVCQRCRQVIGRGIFHPSNCTITDRRENIRQSLEEDPRGAEIAASELLKQKAEEAPKGASSVQIATKGPLPLSVPVPGSSNPMKARKCLFDNSPVPAAAVSQMMQSEGLSLNKVKGIAQNMRTWKGRDALEPGLMDKLRLADKSLEEFFTVTECQLDSSLKEERSNGGKVPRSVVHCNNIDGLIDRIRDHRKYHRGTDLECKIGIDGGGKFLKVCLNIERKFDDFTSPEKQKSRSSYADGASTSAFRDSGVKKLIILAIVEDVSESYSNVKTLLNLIGSSRACICKCIHAFDMKLANVFLGLGTASSTYPCPWCELSSKDFNDPIFLMTGGNPRTLGSIRKNSLLYKSAVSKHTGKQKLSSAPFKNCEEFPLSDLPDETWALDVVAPMELHFHIGIVNLLCDLLKKIFLDFKGCTITLATWAGPLGLERSAHYGGQFDGNQCRKLLENVDRLQDIIKQSGSLLFNKCAPVLEAFYAFNAVRKACFGVDLAPDYHRHIQNFAQAFQKLERNVTPKAHGILVHVAQFLERQNRNKGLGFWSEQASESVHKDFDSLWVGSSYKRGIGHPQYSSQLMKCVVTYNSRHQ